MSTILTHAVIDKAEEAVNEYVTSVSAYYSEIEQIVNSLTASGFVGDAADGYRDFFLQKIMPSVTDNLTGDGSITGSVKQMLESIKAQMLDTVDPKMGESNRNPGGK